MGNPTLFAAAAGINNLLDNVRTPKDLESGLVDLVSGVNITLDESGRPNRRSGRSLLVGGDFHSLFATESDCYVGVDDALYRVGTDLSLTGVRDGMTRSRIAFVETPRGILYANGVDRGRLVEGRSLIWKSGEYVGPETTRQFSGPPAGIRHLEYFAGRIFAAMGNQLVWSEPFAEDLWDMARNFLPLPSPIRMIKSVDTGLFVSDEDTTWFLPGTDPQEFTQRPAGLLPAFEWSALQGLVPMSDLGLDGVANIAVWTSPFGLTLGLPDGSLVFPVRDRIEVPAGFHAGATVRDGRNLLYTIYQ
ncbi:MAG: hypothetical protein ACK5PS_08940 [Desulfopila sp.]